MNDQSLLVKESVRINAPLSKVWEVLVAPKYIRQWDSLPEDFADYYLEEGRVIEWSGHSRLTVTEARPHELLRMALYVYKWEKRAADYDISYIYTLTGQEDGTLLELSAGDFAALPDGKDYYDSSMEFARLALEKIKNLAENKV